MPMLDADAATFRAVEELKRIYKSKILPLEQNYKFEDFYSPSWTDSEFDSKPQVMLIGQYSTGKTTFIRHMIGKDFPGQRIGPEPTTDKFTVVLHGRDDRTIPGNTLALKRDMPYRGLEKFGVNFLNKFEGAQVNSDVLRNLSLIDTPGVLSGDKQTSGRGYNYIEIASWFAVRCDIIILLFDTMKLDISDEFKAILQALSPYHDKIRCVLNKADQVDKQRLIRVYGALMWNLGKVINSTEVLHVYVGSFWDQPLVYDDNAALFAAEQRDLMKELVDLPRNSTIRKINELVKRIRLLKAHAFITGHLRDQIPTFGKQKKMEQLIADLDNVFTTVQTRYNLNAGDFPPVSEMREKLRGVDMGKFAQLKPQLLEALDTLLERDIPRLMESLPGVSANGGDGVCAEQLLNLLGNGLQVIKHGRKGSPKVRLLRCNPAVTRIYWTSDLRAKELPDDSKSVSLREVNELRKATDPDPDHPGEYGTIVFRRHKMKQDELENSFSLILRDRTLDIQCESTDDFLTLFSNLQRQIMALKDTGPSGNNIGALAAARK